MEAPDGSGRRLNRQYVVAQSEAAAMSLFHERIAAIMRSRLVSEQEVAVLNLTTDSGHEPVARGMTRLEYAKLLVEKGLPAYCLGSLPD